MNAPTYHASLRRYAVESLKKTLAIGLLFALSSLPTPSSAGKHSESAPEVVRSESLVEISGGKIGFRQVGRQDADHRNQNSHGSNRSDADTGGTVLAQAGGPVSSTDHDVVIVGAGAAGLYAAFTLIGQGYNVLILEATDKHGGRVHSSTLGDVDIEHGAEELYGNVGGNPIFNDINALYGPGAQTKIFLENNNQDTLIVMDADGMGGASTCFVATGNCDEDADIYDYWDFYYTLGSHSSDPTDELVSTVLAASPWFIDSSSRNWHLFEGGSPAGEYGTTVEKIGIRSLSREPWSLGGSVYGLGPVGYLDALNTLYFNSVLGSVTFNSPVTIIDISGIKPVAIDSNGVYHYADAIIVTVSLGVLKAGIIDFIPDLPAEKLTAISTIGMGNGMKMSLRFSSQIWETKMFYVLLDGPTASCWVPKKYQPSATDHVLTCFSMGRNSEVLEALPDDTARLNQALIDLDAAFGGTATPAFIEGHVHNWTASPYVLGSYSFPAPGTFPDSGLSKRLVLAQQVGTTLYFAGEATNNTAAATVPGAMLSGERAGGEVNTTLGGPPAPGTPTADFSALVTSGPAPLDVSFTDLSNQLPTGWSWNFGDTGTSSVQHPNHLYTTPGDYTVSLTATNPSGSHTRVMPLMISVPEPSVSATLVSGVFVMMLMQFRRRQMAMRRR